MTTLIDDLRTLAAAIGAPADVFIGYAHEDELGGYHADESQRTFPVGSLWGVEGQTLYALVRYLKPDHVVEVGTCYGASAIHILTALEKNEKGRLTTIDIQEGAGAMIPDNLMHRCTKIAAKGQDAIASLEDAQIVFEDAAHSADDAEQIIRAALDHLSPKIILSHDAEHFLVGEAIREAWRRVFGDAYHTLKSDPSDCGLAYKVF